MNLLPWTVVVLLAVALAESGCPVFEEPWVALSTVVLAPVAVFLVRESPRAGTVGLLLFLSAVAFGWTHWVSELVPESVPLVGRLMVLSPWLLVMAVLYRSSDSPDRGPLLVLVPYAVVTGLFDLTYHHPPLRDTLLLDVRAQLVVALLILVGVMFASGALWKRLFHGHSLPQGELREQIEDLCRDANVKLDDVIVWRTGGVARLDARVVGVSRPWRYVCFTETWLELPAQCVAHMVAHELGHTRLRHIPVMALAVATWLLGYFALRPYLPPDSTVSLIAIGLVTVGYFRFFVGALSRSQEFAADLYGARLCKDAAYRSTLELLAELQEQPDRRGWRHPALHDRIRQLGDPGSQRTHARRGRALLVILFFGFVAATVGTAVAVLGA